MTSSKPERRHHVAYRCPEPRCSSRYTVVVVAGIGGPLAGDSVAGRAARYGDFDTDGLPLACTVPAPFGGEVEADISVSPC